jgi:hypothetical protein
MMRSLVVLSCVGGAIYALLVVTDKMMPVVPDGTRADIVARQTRLSVWGPHLPHRSLNQKQLDATKQFAPAQEKIASRENAAVRSPPVTLDARQTVTSASQDDQTGKQLASFEPWVPARDDEVIWFVVSRAARLHAGPSVSSPIMHFYPVGTELKRIGYEQGWFHVLDPTTSRTGWIYERYYLDAIPGPGQTQLVVQGSPPTRVAFVASEPKPVNRIKQPRPAKKLTKPKREQRIRMASARADESVASIMERAFRRY